ncbi:MAG: dihydrolipoyllysine-residue acetyltransferase [Sinobacteraceae bacterium]|nr:dihydrolipoyllysine-residue acetyltransferase [Nevskiaceae bacterium]
MAKEVEVRVPDIGDYHDVPVIDVLVKPGDRVEKEAPLVTLESDKATMDVPAPEPGVVKRIALKVGDKVSQGSTVAVLELDGALAPAVPAPQETKPSPQAPAAAAPPPAPPAPKPADTNEGLSSVPLPPSEPAPREALPHASPAVRKFARELGVDLRRVAGSGPRGRITREDVQTFVKNNLSGPGPRDPGLGEGIPKIPAVDFAQFGPVETRPLARIRKLSAAHLHRAWLNVPHVTQTDEADITELEAFRKAQSAELGLKLTLLPFIMKAVSVALAAYPEFNSSLAPDGETLILKKYCHIGFAADTDMGLVVPVVRDVDKKGIAALARECAELAARAREGKLKAEDMKGGCFSISSLGGIGGSHFTPIVNAPEVAILGVSRATLKPVWDGGQFQPRLMLPLSLSYDHRVIDGAAAARFIVHLVKLLTDLRRLSL